MRDGFMITHRPKAIGFCDRCANKNADCSSLDFTKMQVIKTDKDGVKVVKCSQFERELGNG